MKIGIMQPYLFPYMGYFQLVNAVDNFIFFDDVNYIKKGWINKNNILINNVSNKFTTPIKDASQNKLINQIKLIDFENWRKKFFKTIEHAYKKAPYFKDTFELISDVLNKKYETISELAIESVQTVALFLDFKTNFEKSSNISYNRQLSDGQQKILEICFLKKGTIYINPINGKDLYNKENFSDNNIELKFIYMNNIKYNQFIAEEYTPSLSIIDVLMFNSKEDIRIMLEDYSIA